MKLKVKVVPVGLIFLILAIISWLLGRTATVAMGKFKFPCIFEILF